MRSLGLVVHPTRNVDGPRRAVHEWSAAHDVELTELPFTEPDDGARGGGCDLIVAIGGDGTTLAAVRRAARLGRPVLGVACGSLGVLTSVPASDVVGALQRYNDGDWLARAIPALDVTTGDGETMRAFNDVAIVREGGGQMRVFARLDGALFARLAGDGCIVSTAVGSSAYTIAAGGPLLDPTLQAFVLTPLPTHGGFSPPLVMAAQSNLELEIMTGYGGGRLELDGRVVGEPPERLEIALRCAAATMVAFADQESHLSGLRRRGIIADSPRILAEDQRD